MKNKKIILISVIAILAVIIAVVIGVKVTNSPSAPAENKPVEATQQPVNQEADKTEPESEETPEPEKQAEEPKPVKKEAEPEAKEEKVYTPTFMYFVSNADKENAEKLIGELKNKYKDKVVFDLRNIDENPDDAKNFPVSGNTPALIMLNSKNDISAIEFMCSDKSKLEKIIEASLKP